MNTRMRGILATFCSLMLLLSATAIMAQAPTGTLRGVVLDPAGARITGAQVTITDNATGTHYTSQTGSTGEFTISNLNAGDYTATITKASSGPEFFRTSKLSSAKLTRFRPSLKSAP